MSHGRYFYLLALAGLLILSPQARSADTLHFEEQPLADSQDNLLIAWTEKQQEMLSLINAARREQGLNSVTFSSALARAAQTHVEDIVENNYGPTHIGSDGSSVGDRAEREGYPTRYVGENVAAGHNSVEETFEQWMNSPGHRANILNPNYTELGIGYYLNAPRTAYKHYWVLVLGNPSR